MYNLGVNLESAEMIQQCVMALVAAGLQFLGSLVPRLLLLQVKLHLSVTLCVTKHRLKHCAS